MRILFLSDFYPPVKGGGYAQLCQEVAQQLTRRGHHIDVLTSNFKLHEAPQGETRIYRLLYLEGDLDYYRPLDFLLHWKRQFKENITIFQKIISQVKPEVILLWNLRRLSKSLAAIAEGSENPPTAYYLAGYWPVAENTHKAYWRTPARHGTMRFLKRLVSAVALRQVNRLECREPAFRHVMCVSNRLKKSLIDQGLQIEGARVVYNGVDPLQFSMKSIAWEGPAGQNPYRLIYAGQIAPHKGVHTAVEALGQLINDRAIENIHLTLRGSGHPDYEAYLRNLIEDLDLQAFIDFLPPVPRENMPALLHQYDAMVLPSIYEEPLARSIQEGMACGLAILTTLTGGTREIITDGENGLCFLPKDAAGLASQIERLMFDQDLRERLVKAGRKMIVERFNIQRSVDEIETYLLNIAESSLAPSIFLAPA